MQTALGLDSSKTVYDIEDELNKWFDKGWKLIPIVIKTKDGNVFVLEKEVKHER
jgi:hypothetical protein